ncbi:MAG: efflux RND transporter periplasmic adaptor subunit [Pseudomonadota bacterium]
MAGLAVGGIIGAAAMIGAAQFIARSPTDVTAAKGGQPGRQGPTSGRGPARTPAVAFAQIEPAAIGVRLSSIGVARSIRSVDITSEVAGIVVDVRFTPGQAVKAGDVLLRLDDREQRIALERAKAQYPIARRNARRFAALARDDAGSQVEADTAATEAERLAAEVKSAEFELSRRTISAPFDGVLGLADIEPGDLVSAAQLVVSIDDTRRMIVAFPVPQEASRDVAIGQEAELIDPRAPGGRIPGAVTAIDSRVDPAARTLMVEGTFENEDGAIRPGATFEVETRSRGAEALRAPSIAVQWDRTGSFVWALDKAGAAKRVGVVIAQREPDSVLIRGPLAPGDVVISDGADRVRPGMVFDRRRTTPRGGAAGAGAAAGGLD